MKGENRFVSHMEKRYGETFEYIGDKNGVANKSGFTVRLSNSRFPGKEILVMQRKEEDSFSYLDNYMAYVFHDEAKQRIEEAVGGVFRDFWVYFPVPGGVFDTGTGEYKIEDYLQEENANLNITVLIYGEKAEDEQLQALISAFEQNGIVLQCTAVFVNQTTVWDSVTEENLANYMVKTGWYDGIADFWLRQDGEIGYLDWR